MLCFQMAVETQLELVIFQEFSFILYFDFNFKEPFQKQVLSNVTS